MRLAINKLLLHLNCGGDSPLWTQTDYRIGYQRPFAIYSIKMSTELLNKIVEFNKMHMLRVRTENTYPHDTHFIGPRTANAFSLPTSSMVVVAVGRKSETPHPSRPRQRPHGVKKTYFPHPAEMNLRYLSTPVRSRQQSKMRPLWYNGDNSCRKLQKQPIYHERRILYQNRKMQIFLKVLQTDNGSALSTFYKYNSKTLISRKDSSAVNSLSSKTDAIFLLHKLKTLRLTCLVNVILPNSFNITNYLEFQPIVLRISKNNVKT